NAFFPAPRLRVGLQRRGLLLVGPEAQLPGRRSAAAVGGAAAPGVAVGVRVRAAAGGQQGGARGEAAEGEEALSTNLHVFSFESRSSRLPTAALDALTLEQGAGCVQECARTCRFRFGHGR